MNDQLPFKEPTHIFHHSTTERIDWSDNEIFIEYDLIDKGQMNIDEGAVIDFVAMHGKARGKNIYAAVLPSEIDTSDGWTVTEYSIEWFKSSELAEEARKSALEGAWKISDPDWPFGIWEKAA